MQISSHQEDNYAHSFWPTEDSTCDADTGASGEGARHSIHQGTQTSDLDTKVSNTLKVINISNTDIVLSLVNRAHLSKCVVRVLRSCW